MTELPKKSLTDIQILVAEDNCFTQKLIGLILRQWNIPVDYACNGQEALDLAIKNRYDVIFMDIMMPEIDGYTVSMEIRSRSEAYFKKVPIYAFTAIPDTEMIEKSGMNGHISKTPIDKEQISRIIRALIS